jgi:hypothetical protein
MQFIPADAYQYLHMMSGMGIPMPSGSQAIAEYGEWVSQHNSSASSTPAPAGTQASFYFVLAFPQGDFADKLEIHEKYPMFVPATGTFPPILGVFADEKQAKIKMEEDDTNVHLLYKCKVPGASGIQHFLELLAENGMLETVTGN